MGALKTGVYYLSYVVGIVLTVWVAVTRLRYLKTREKGAEATLEPDAAFGPSSPFWWHPFLMCLGFFICISWGTIYKKTGSEKKDRLIHGIGSAIGAALILVGFLIIFFFKKDNKLEHFKVKTEDNKSRIDVHAILGIIAIGLMAVPVLLGSCVWPCCQWKKIRKSPVAAFFHTNIARLSCLLAFVAAMNKFWVDSAMEAGTSFTVAAIMFCIVCSFLLCFLLCGLAPNQTTSAEFESPSKAARARKKGPAPVDSNV